MNTAISIISIQQLFTAARTHHAWQDRDIADGLLHEIYDLAKWGPTSANSLPMRIVFVKSKSAKEKLMPALAGSNAEQVRAAPVTAIVAYDQKFQISGSVLDAGCGTGDTALFLAGRGSKVTSIDFPVSTEAGSRSQRGP